MSTYTHRQEVFDRTGKLVAYLEHVDTPAPRPRMQQAPAKTQLRLMNAQGEVYEEIAPKSTLDEVLRIQKEQGRR